MEQGKKNFPWIGALAVAAVSFFVFFVIQNAEAVSVNFLFWRFELSLVLLILFSFFGGILIGWSLSYLRRKKH